MAGLHGTRSTCGDFAQPPKEPGRNSFATAEIRAAAVPDKILMKHFAATWGKMPQVVVLYN